MSKRNWHRWWKWGTIATATVLLVALAAGWLMFQHIPAWYHPLEIPPEQVQSVRDDFVGTFDRLSELLNTSPGPFEFRLRQDQVNAWLVSREQMWPESRRWLSPQLSDPQVIVDRSGVRLGATFRHGGVRSVLSAQFEVHADQGGVAVKLAGVSAGSLPMPRSKVRELLATIDARHWPAGRRGHGQVDDRPLPALAGLYEGIILPNGWIWQNGRRPFRITRLTCEPGEIVAIFEPLPRQVSRPSRRSEPADSSSDVIWNISPGSRPAGSR